MRRLKRWRLPEWLSAMVIVLGLLGLLVYGGYSLVDPAAAWLARAPESFAKVEEKLQRFRKPVEQVTRTAERVGELTTVAGASNKGALPVQVKDTRLTDRPLRRHPAARSATRS